MFPHCPSLFPTMSRGRTVLAGGYGCSVDHAVACSVPSVFSLRRLVNVGQLDVDLSAGRLLIVPFGYLRYFGWYFVLSISY